MTAASGVVLIEFGGTLLVTARQVLDIRIFHSNVFAPFLIVIYALMARVSYFHEQRAGLPISSATELPRDPVKLFILRYLIAAGLVAIADVWLPFIGMEIAESTG